MLSAVTQLKIRDICWRAREASETVLGVDNERSCICYMYITCVRMIRMSLKCARGELKNHVFLGLTPVYYETTALSKPYFILKRRSVRKFLRKRMLFKKQKVAATCYYGIENPLPDLNSKLRSFRGIQSAACWLSRVIGSQNAVVLMLRNLLLLEGS